MWRIVYKLIGFLLLTLLIIPIGSLARLTKNPQHVLALSQLYFTSVAWLLGLRTHVHGAINKNKPLLIISNHISYTDIIALGAAAPLTFIPKSEIETWPLIGFLCKLIGCVFVDRRRTQTKTNMGNIEAGLKAGKPLVLFAEGTTSDGRGLLPIRSSYFQIVELMDEPVHIQPVLLRYTRINGLPMDETQRYDIAWVGDEELVPHLKKLLTFSRIDVDIHFLPEINVGECKTRKEIARMCEERLEGKQREL